MNDFITQLVEDIMVTIEEDKNYTEKILRSDIKHLIAQALNDHDEKIRREARAMLDEDEIYDEGHEDGYVLGWEDAKQEIIDNINEMIRKNH